MDHLLSLSQAARMVGVTRGELQRHIRAGRLDVFEGSIRMSELKNLYKDVLEQATTSAMVEKTRKIKEQALYKYSAGSLPERQELHAEVHRLKLQLVQAEEELAEYQTLTQELHARLRSMHERCDKQQKELLAGVMTWLLHEMKQHKHHGV